MLVYEESKWSYKEYLDEDEVEIECPNGHRFTLDDFDDTHWFLDSEGIENPQCPECHEADLFSPYGRRIQ